MDKFLYGDVISLTGLIVIMCTLLSYFFPNSIKISDQKQLFKGKGIEFNLSTRMFLIFIGVVLFVPGLYFYHENYTEQIDKLNDTIKRNTEVVTSIQKELEKFQTNSITCALQFNDSIIGSKRPDPKDMECRLYDLNGGRDTVGEPKIVQLGSGEGYIIELEKIRKDPFLLKKIVVTHKKSGKRWESDNFNPSFPQVLLTSVDEKN